LALGLAAWNWPASRNYFEGHADLLAGPNDRADVPCWWDADEERRVAIHGALLGLAQHHQTDVAYALLTSADRHAALRSGLTRATTDGIGSLIELAEAFATTPADRADATIRRAIETILTDGSYTDAARAAGAAAADLAAMGRVEWITIIRTLATPDGPFAAIHPLADAMPCRPNPLPRTGTQPARA
jgi:hypothetical protein